MVRLWGAQPAAASARAGRKGKGLRTCEHVLAVAHEVVVRGFRAVAERPESPWEALCGRPRVGFSGTRRRKKPRPTPHRAAGLSRTAAPPRTRRQRTKQLPRACRVCVHERRELLNGREQPRGSERLRRRGERRAEQVHVLVVHGRDPPLREDGAEAAGAARDLLDL